IGELETALTRLEVDEAREADAAHRRRELAVRAAGLEERRTLVARRLYEVQARLDAHEAEAGGDAALARVTRIELSAVAVERLARLVAAHREVVELRLAELHEERRRQTDEARTASLRLEQLRRERADAERTLTELAERERRAEIDDAEG